jgi:hypothetical protein
MPVGVFSMNIENRKTYKYFLNEFEELLKTGFTTEQAVIILRRIDRAINVWKGYHYEHISLTAGESLNYLIEQIEKQEQEQERNEHILDNLTHGFSPMLEQEA